MLHQFRNSVLLFSAITVMFSSCIMVEDHHEPVYYGPAGYDGKVFFGIDYDYAMPYSYWDNNPSVPNNPYFGDFYQTHAGIYDFEYFVNPYEYWYGTYETYQVFGGPGGPNGQPGADGNDTYLLLICNPDGFYFEGWEECTCYKTILEDGSILFEGKDGDQQFRVIMKKTNTDERPSSHQPKLVTGN